MAGSESKRPPWRDKNDDTDYKALAEEHEDILKLVLEMRTYQKKYFKDRKQDDLIESKRLEKRVDTALDAAEIKL